MNLNSSRLLDFEKKLCGQRVFVTGHTGFTGAWLVTWLKSLRCDVAGLALAPNTEPNLFAAADIGKGIVSNIGDIRDASLVRAVIDRHRPAVIFHLAAQPLVSRSFEDPLDTFATNALGTANVLEAARHIAGVRAVVCVTTDKVYRDRQWVWGYRETDELGGKDAYSASKACAELIAGAYRATLAARGNGVLIANARGGNIIGGGDWSADRIVPDFVRAVTSGAPLVLRNPDAVRPWQHVLALVHGYLLLAARLLSGDDNAAADWNFGPGEGETASVGDLVAALAAAWTAPVVEYAPGSFPETQLLRIDSSKARSVLKWQPAFRLDQSIRSTAEWYRDYLANPSDAARIVGEQVEAYQAAMLRAVDDLSLREHK